MLVRHNYADMGVCGRPLLVEYYADTGVCDHLLLWGFDTRLCGHGGVLMDDSLCVKIGCVRAKWTRWIRSSVRAKWMSVYICLESG